MSERLKGYRCWAASHRGLVRAENEDAFAVSSSSAEWDQRDGLIPSADGWAFIVDGMGGHAGGKVASRLALECLKDLSDMLGDEDGIEAALAAIHQSMFSAMRKDPALWGMGTTVAGVILSADEALCFNVGDSRIYHMGSKLSLVSEDHVVNGNMLTQCLGGTSATSVPEPSFVRVLWKRGQRLLLCTDGLTDMVNDHDIAAILERERRTPAEALISAALRAGGKDNVTAIVLERLG